MALQQAGIAAYVTSLELHGEHALIQMLHPTKFKVLSLIEPAWKNMHAQVYVPTYVQHHACKSHTGVSLSVSASCWKLTNNNIASPYK